MSSASPRATYRLQLGPSFGFDGARRIVPYLDRLGISHLYLSPIWKARSASTHNYDVVDPTALDPRLGPRDDFDALVAEVKERGMGIVCDVVPNHMAASHENPWWWDVLSNGPASPHAGLFDIDWERGDGRVVLPILGSADDAPWVDGDVRRYHDHVLPLDDRHYVTVDWKTGEQRINYRRFFDINDLVATTMDEPWQIDRTHALVFELAASGAVAGLRIDHIDGLNDPAKYLAYLRSRLPESCFVLVEKILARDEALPDGWATIGTTGYEHADIVEAAMVDPDGAATLRAFASRMTGIDAEFRVVARDAKREAVTSLFAAEVEALSDRISSVTALEPVPVRDGVIGSIVDLDVYRTYISPAPVVEADRARVMRATERVDDDEVRTALRRVLSSDDRDPVIVARWQQLCAPAEAKGVEDTALYRDVALTSRNEVGSDPGAPAIDLDGFHAFNASRRARWPGAMNTSSTHDSKRGEDVRARIDVLSEIPNEWLGCVERLHDIVGPAPDPWAESLVYQTLVGAWPISQERLCAYVIKAARESKLRTDWRRIDEAYERELLRFVARICSDERFISELTAFVRRIAPHGAMNSLARLVIKVTAPGFPDVYQGTEAWYLRLVDPDNRSSVDLGDVDRALEAFDAAPRELLETWEDGRLKLCTMVRALGIRRRWPDLFAEGEYLEVTVVGRRARNVIAFARRLGPRWAVTVVPRFTTELSPAFATGTAWAGTEVVMPPGAPARWTEVISGAPVSRTGLDAIFASSPVAVLIGG